MKRGLISAKRSITSNDPWLPEYLGLQNINPYGSVSVDNGETAMKLAAVYRSVSILSGTVASLPIFPRRKTPKGNFEIDEDNPLYYLLAWKASDRLNTYEMFESAAVQVLMNGNAYIYPKYSRGEPVQLILLSIGSVVYDIFTDKYYINDAINGIFDTCDSWRIIHFRGKNLDGGKQGMSVIHYAGRVLNISANADNQTLSNMKTGNKQKGFLTGGDIMAGMGKIQDSQVDKVAQRLEGELASDKSVMRLPGELKWHPYSISPADAQILENRKFSVFDICRFFGVHPDKVFVEQTSNYKASENSQTLFMTDTLQPLLVQMEKELSTKLIPKKLVGRKEIILYDRVALYHLDPANAAKRYKDMFDVGGLTSNEIRILENHAPVEGGDVAFVSANVAPITSKKIYGESVTGGPNGVEGKPKEPVKTE